MHESRCQKCAWWTTLQITCFLGDTWARDTKRNELSETSISIIYPNHYSNGIVHAAPHTHHTQDAYVIFRNKTERPIWIFFLSLVLSLPFRFVSVHILWLFSIIEAFIIIIHKHNKPIGVFYSSSSSVLCKWTRLYHLAFYLIWLFASHFISSPCSTFAVRKWLVYAKLVLDYICCIIIIIIIN